MKVLLQWTKLDPDDWVEIDLTTSGQGARRWLNLPKKPEPTGNESIDNNAGWVFDLNVQGVCFAGYDHYLAEPITGGIKIIVWNDDPEDWPPGTRYAQVWIFLSLAPDPRFGGQLNTRQSRIIYSEDPRHAELANENTVVRSWSEFVPPPANLTAHGIWVDENLMRLHGERRAFRGWREWGA